MAITLSDVAKRSGVSIGTVSRALNGKRDLMIPPDTIERIKRVADELGYRPNLTARALATGKTRTLGLYSAEMTDPHFAQMLEATEATALEHNYHLIVSSALEVVSWKGRVDGCIILGSPDAPQFAALKANPNTVFVFSSVEPQPNLIGWNDQEGMRLATEHLLTLGHRRIAALFCYRTEMLAFQPKVVGFRAAIQAAKAEAVECWEPGTPESISLAEMFEAGYQATQKLLQEAHGVTAIVARNDFLALGALRALREAGIAVPEAMSVVGYTDSIHALCADPALTSVRTPIAAAGKLAVEATLRAIQQSETPYQGRLLPTSLTQRSSCASPTRPT